MFRLSFRRLFRLEARFACRPRPRPQAGPRVECLEDRLAPATLTVGFHEQYATINAALGAAHAGDTIKVDPGVYTQPLDITLNNIKLIGANQQSIISTSASTPASQSLALVQVDGAKNVLISGFTITGPGNGGGSIGYGVLVDNGGSANITNDHVTNIRDNPISGDQNGIGIFVGTSASVVGTSGTGTATISQDTVDNYQKGGIVVSGVGSSAVVANNTVQGSPNNTAIPSNGIEIGHGATASVWNNTVLGNVFTGPVTDGEHSFEGSLPLGYQGVGILLYKAGAVNVYNNNASANDIGIWDFAGAAGTQIRNNTVSFSTFDGIVLEELGIAAPPVGTQVLNNTASNNAHDGIEFVFDPTGSESGTSDTQHSHNVQVMGNSAFNNGNVGIDVEQGSTGNLFNNNRMSGNSLYDAQDLSTGSGTSGTGNIWRNNRGRTSNPLGLVR
jgi:parallel beta-helix repeat protein